MDVERGRLVELLAEHWPTTNIHNTPRCAHCSSRAAAPEIDWLSSQVESELLALQAVLDLSGKDQRVTLKVEQIAAARRDKLQSSKVRLLFASPPLSATKRY